MLDKNDILNFQRWATDVVKKCAEILAKYKNNFNVVKRKEDYNDIATDADIAIENFVCEQIKNTYGNHSIYAEELGMQKKDSDFCWIIDPLDGTKEFARNLPYYGINLALEYKKELIVGIFYHPETNRFFSAAKGHGAARNKKEISVSKNLELTNSYLYSCIPHRNFTFQQINKFSNMLQKLISKSYRTRGTPWVVEAFCNIASGSYDGLVSITTSEFGPKWYDIAPGILILEEAGGRVTDFFGKPLNKNNLESGIVASNNLLHQKLLDIVKY